MLFPKLALTAALATSASLAFAQTTATPSESEEGAVDLDEYVITGSYIPYAAEAPAIPLKVIDSAAISAVGEPGDLLEVIRKTLPQFVGNSNLGSANSNISGGATNGGSQVQIRNVETLVLINGRRAALAPVAATGGYTFVDVNSIPVSAVDRIEVVTDGASAVYGSDAVSGVVNILLSKDFQGAEIGTSFRSADGWNETAYRAVLGTTSGDTSITVSIEHLESDPIFENQREFSSQQTGKTSNYPGRVDDFGFNDDPDYSNDGGVFLLRDGQTPPANTDLDGPSLVAAGIYEGPGSFNGRFNIAEYVTLALGNKKTGVTTMFSHTINPNLEVFGDILYSQTDTYYQLAAQPIVGMPLTAAGVTDFGIGVGVTNPDHPQNPFNTYVLVRNRFVDHPREYQQYTDSLRTLAGLRGKINENWSFEGALNFNQVDQDYKNRNVINRVALSNAIDAGLVNMFAKVQDEAALAQGNIFGIASSRNESSLFTGDFHVRGKLFEMPAGAVQVAVGYEHRKESLSGAPDAGSYTILDPNSPQYGQPSMWDGATTADPFDESRTVDALFAQVRIPITAPEQKIAGLYTLDLDVAVRHERYSDTDDPTVPKLLLRYLPASDEFAIRGVYAESFTAPDLYSLFGPSGVGYTDTLANFERADGGIIGEDDADQALLRLTTNPNLEPEKAKTYNVGFVYSPRKIQGLSLEASYFNIKQENIVGRVSDQDVLQDVELNGTASEYVDRVRFGSFNGTPVTGVGQISAAYDQFGTFGTVFLSNYSENFVEAQQDGVDLRVSYAREVGALGTMNSTLNGVWFNSFKVEDDEMVGTTNGNSVLNGGTVPDWRANLLVALTKERLNYGFNIDHIPSVTDTGAAPDETDPDSDAYVESFTRVDLFVGYRFGGSSGIESALNGLSVRVGVNNVFDTQPPMAKASWEDSGSDTGTYDWLGRVIYVNASYKF